MGDVEENKAVIRRFVEEVQNDKNWDVFDELNAEDFVNHSAPPGVPNDREGGKLYLAAFMGAFPDCQFTIDDDREARDVAVRRHHASPRRADRRTLAHDGSAVLHATTRSLADLVQSSRVGRRSRRPATWPCLTL